MKNYRRLEMYKINEWEEDDEWKAKRLAFLWLVQEERPDLYKKNNLSEEKYELYEIKTNKMSKIALEEYSIDFNYYENFYKDDYEKMALDYMHLHDMKINNFNSFILKKNCNKFNFLEINFYEFKENYDCLLQNN